jgi:hypothetical protein
MECDKRSLKTVESNSLNLNGQPALKPCLCCGGAANISVCVLLSSRGTRPRRQACSRALLLCSDCLQGWLDADAVKPLAVLTARVNEAFTALNEDFMALRDSKR